MKGLSRLVICFVVLWIGWKFLQFLFPSDQTRIERKLSRLESLVSYGPSTTALAHLAAAGAIQEMFDPEAQLQIKAESQSWKLQGREEIRTAVLSSRQQRPQGMAVRITDPLFEPVQEGGFASVVTVTVQFEGELEPMVRILELHWRKGARSQWLIHRIETRKDLEWGGD